MIANSSSMARLAYANIFAKDIDALSRFYSELLGLPLMPEHASPIYRCLDAGAGFELGFNADQAYDLLGVGDRRPANVGSVGVYFTFEVSSASSVDAIAEQAVMLGGRIVKAPYDTYYNARQTVLEDPERNIFRINFRKGPRVPAAEVENPSWAASKVDMA
jgi:predicted enzyme related to lactoylglutathione lyase